MENTHTLKESFKIGSSRLSVEIAHPGGIYRGSRFDWTGFITQVTLDGLHTFCVPEQYEPGKGSGGIGLCNEFGIDTPVGYEEAKPGDRFPKIGIGLLTRKSEAPYNFFEPYAVDPYPFTVSYDGESAKFIAQPVDCRGYAVRLTKIVCVRDNHITIDYKLENTGSKTIVTNEYCHNFAGIDRHVMGKDYCLSFPYKIRVNRTAGSFTSHDDRILWEETPDRDFYGIIEREPGNEPYQWQLLHVPSGVGMREISRLPVSKFAVWGSTHVVSPELFVKIVLKPGELQTWTREYEFFC
jgi:hypothetical protein